MKPPRTILALDHDKSFLTQFKSLLDGFYTVFLASEEQEAWDILQRENVHIMFFNEAMQANGVGNLDFLKKLKDSMPFLPVIVLSDQPSVETAVEAIKIGAYHYSIKSLRLGELRALIEKAMQEQYFKRDYERIRDELNRLSGKIVGDSPEIRRILDQVRRVAMTDVTVLILGESGTGKELVAQEVHTASKRKDRPFVAVNCASLVKGLIESELFGHQRGSFTGALHNKLGRFELAEGGTIFLDEIADLDLQSQVKLLRVLQEKVIDRVGGTTSIPVDVRVVAATNRNLSDMTAKGEFREDLYYRFNIFPITMPALREHKEDIPLLAEYYVQRYGPELGKPNLAISQSAIEYLTQYEWPGNVRELQNTIQRAILFCSNQKIESIDLPKEITEGKASSAANVPLPVVEKQARESAARLAILGALEQTGWNVKKSAEVLSIPEKTLYDKCSNFWLEQKMPFHEILQIMSNNVKDKNLKRALRDIIKDLKEGMDSRDAFLRQAPTFGDDTALMLGLASRSGNMKSIFESVARFVERLADFKKALASSLILPAVTSLALVGALVFHVLVLLPKMAETLGPMASLLPPVTQFTLDFSNFVKQNILLLSVAFTLPSIAFYGYIMTPNGRLMFDRFIIRVPYVGRILQNTSVEMFCRTLGIISLNTRSRILQSRPC